MHTFPKYCYWFDKHVGAVELSNPESQKKLNDGPGTSFFYGLRKKIGVIFRAFIAITVLDLHKTGVYVKQEVDPGDI